MDTITGLIYGLYDPRDPTKRIRYIGQTIDLKQRLKQHQLGLTGGLLNWVAGIRIAKHHVAAAVLLDNVPAERLDIEEQLLITKYRMRGQADLNTKCPIPYEALRKELEPDVPVAVGIVRRKRGVNVISVTCPYCGERHHHGWISERGGTVHSHRAADCSSAPGRRDKWKGYYVEAHWPKISKKTKVWDWVSVADAREAAQRS